MKGENTSHELNLSLFKAITGANAILATKTLKSIKDPETLKAVLTAKDEDEDTPLCKAIDENHIEITRIILNAVSGDKELLSNILLKKDIFGATRLNQAIDEGNIEITGIILNAVSGDKELLSNILLKKGIFGYTPLHKAIDEGNIVITPIILNAACNDKELLRKILLKKDIYGYTPLHKAIDKGNIEITRIILNAVSGDKKLLRDIVSESKSSKRKSGDNALYFALKKDKEDIAILILNTIDPKLSHELISKKICIEHFAGTNTRELFCKIGGVDTTLIIKNLEKIESKAIYFRNCVFITYVPLRVVGENKLAQFEKELKKLIDKQHHHKIINPYVLLWINEIIFNMEFDFKSDNLNIDQLHFWHCLKTLPHNKSHYPQLTQGRYNLAAEILKYNFAQNNRLDSSDFIEKINKYENINTQYKDVLEWAKRFGYKIPIQNDNSNNPAGKQHNTFAAPASDFQDEEPDEYKAGELSPENTSGNTSSVTLNR